jgi:glucosylceramidase
MQTKEIAVFSTSRDTPDRIAAKQPIPFRDDPNGTENGVVNVYDEVKYQQFIGMGGAFTEAASETFYKLPKDVQDKVIEAYFDPAKGNAYSFCRTHMNSCDFSLGNYEDAAKPGDTKLESFNIEREKRTLIPMIKEAAKRGPFNLFISPWSPPSWMKDTGKMNNGGKLIAKYADAWAEHYALFIEALEKEGIPVWGLTVQNEPKAAQTWDSCQYTAEEEAAFVADHLYPALQRHKLTRVRIMIWDHNKERTYERAAASFKNKKAAEEIWGIAIHWYSGDHFEALDMTHERWPDKPIIFTEGCVSRDGFDKWEAAETYAHDIIGNLNNFTSAFCEWNLLLDFEGGPNHVGNFCTAPVMATPDFKGVTFQPSFYYLGQFSRFIQPGSVRIGCSRYTDKIECTAWLRPDGKKALVVLNRTDEAVSFILRYQDRAAPVESAAHSLMSLVF